MQVDQFESEVESLSVQTRKKKGDKDVSLIIFKVAYYVAVIPANIQCRVLQCSLVKVWLKCLS